MPLNEAASVRRGGLTTQQKKDQLAVLYGLNPKDYHPMTPAGLTIAEIEKMRALVNAADSANQGGNKEFDLAKPPTPPYRYTEYPRAMYDHVKGRPSRNVNSDEEREVAEEAGWSINAMAPVEADEDPFAGLSAEDAAAAREADEKLGLAKPKWTDESEDRSRKPPARKHAGGRPKKVKDQPKTDAATE